MIPVRVMELTEGFNCEILNIYQPDKANMMVGALNRQAHTMQYGYALAIESFTSAIIEKVLANQTEALKDENLMGEHH